MPKDFLTLADWPAADLSRILERAAELKKLQRKGERPQTLLGRTLAMYFEHPSLRTHVTFEAGMASWEGTRSSWRRSRSGSELASRRAMWRSISRAGST